MDRLIFAGLYRLAPTILNALAILKPETVIEWHRVGFRSFWRWKSRRRGGRPTVLPEIRKLIREMSIANPLWGAPRIIRLQNESQIRSRQHAAGNRLPGILSVTGMGLMVTYSSIDFEQWAFAIDQHRRALHGKTLMPKG